MATTGGQPGNTNPADGKLWRAAIRRALDIRTSRLKRKEALDDLAEKFLAQCDEGDISAFRELGDRLDGKATQPISGADGGPVVVEVIKFADTSSR